MVILHACNFISKMIKTVTVGLLEMDYKMQESVHLPRVAKHTPWTLGNMECVKWGYCMYCCKESEAITPTFVHHLCLLITSSVFSVLDVHKATCLKSTSFARHHVEISCCVVQAPSKDREWSLCPLPLEGA